VLRRAAAALDVHPARCAAVVDTPHALYDRQDGYGAVVATGMTGCAVTSEAFDEEVLTQAGARGAYATPNALAADLDAALRRLGPQSVALSQARMEDWMDEALAAAREGMEDGEIPIGSVVVDRDGAVLGRGCNRVRATGRHTHHAEMAAFDDAAGTGLADREGVVLVTTLEPCVMCFGAALQGRVDAIVYAHEAPENGAAGRVGPNRAPGSVLPRMVFGVGRSRSRALLREWNDTTGSGFTRRLFGDE
jgi:tRNA(Arg) A34 adenosine deaminase TadA